MRRLPLLLSEASQTAARRGLGRCVCDDVDSTQRKHHRNLLDRSFHGCPSKCFGDRTIMPASRFREGASKGHATLRRRAFSSLEQGTMEIVGK
jgi:hypothetical protein